MTAVDLIGTAAFVLITCSFFFIRTTLSRFLMSGVCIIGLSALATWRYACAITTADAVVMLVGLALYWFGLLIVRVMLRRSVSLHLLFRYARGDMAANVQSDLARRLEDAQRYRLVKDNDHAYTLTLFGRWVASFASLLRVVARTAP